MATVEVEQVIPVPAAENVEAPTKTVEETVVETEVTQHPEEVAAVTESAPAPAAATEQEPEAPVEETSKELVLEEAEQKDEETEEKVTETPVVVEEEKKEEKEEVKEEVKETPAVVEEKKTKEEEVVAAPEVAAEKTDE